jgi:hypothetical protein
MTDDDGLPSQFSELFFIPGRPGGDLSPAHFVGAIAPELAIPVEI